MRHMRLALPLALVGAVIVGSVVTVAVRGGSPAPAAPAPPPVTTASVVRTDLATTVLTGATLGYAPTDPVVNRLAGTYTQLPAVGAVIASGQVLYRVDNQPVVLMTGTTPAWRPFGTGMTNGPDVAELQSNLIALGDARGLFSTASGRLRRVHRRRHRALAAGPGPTCNRPDRLGQVIFLPSAVLVGAESVAIGQAASPGDLPYQVTTTARTVTVPLNPNLPPVNVGEAVSIVLPTNATTTGKVTAVGPAPPNSSSGSGTASGTGSSQSQASTILTVTPNNPAATGSGSGVAVQVSLTTQSVTAVLAVPVSALLALSGGGYGVEVVSASGSAPPGGCDHRDLCRQPGPGERGGHRSGNQSGRGPVTALELREVTKEHAGTPPVVALRSVTLSIDNGELVAVVGPSGSGKSTLLSIAGTLERPTFGSVMVSGEAVEHLSDRELSGIRATHIGFVFQQFFLVPSLSTLDNVANGLLYRGLPSAERRRAATEALDTVGLRQRRNHRPGELSGGECQRVAIARALVGRPDIILADEPTGSLDTATGRDILRLLAELNTGGTTIVVVTHNLEIADTVSRTIRLRDGSVEHDSQAR